MIVKKNIREGKLFLTIVDSNLIGQKIEEGNKILDLSSSYYKGEETDKEEIIKLCEKAFSIDIIGNESVEFAIENNIANDYSEINNIKHAMIFRTT